MAVYACSMLIQLSFHFHRADVAIVVGPRVSLRHGLCDEKVDECSVSFQGPTPVKTIQCNRFYVPIQPLNRNRVASNLPRPSLGAMFLLR